MWSTVISEVLVTAYQLWIVRHDLDLKLLFKSNWKYLVSGLVMFIPVFWLNTHMKASWLWMIAEVLLGVIIYAGMVFLLRAPVVDQAKDLIKNYFEK